MRLWVLVIVVFLSACTSTTIDDAGQASLYQEFQQFGLLIIENEQLAIETMISDEHVARINTAQENMPEELRSPYFKNLAKKIRTEHSHYEEFKDGKGCLTVNGLDERKRPKSLSLYYIREDSRWVIDSIMVALHESIDAYYREATCPSIGQ